MTVYIILVTFYSVNQYYCECSTIKRTMTIFVRAAAKICFSIALEKIYAMGYTVFHTPV